MSAETILLSGDQAGLSLAAESGQILSYGEGRPPLNRAPRELDCAGALIGPGRVNAHTHIYSGLAPLGMPMPETPPKNFVQILEQIWWRLDRALDQASLRASARLYVAEALLHGTSTLIDHHESPQLIDGSLDILADACEELGVRALLCYGATERNGQREEAAAGLAECRRFLLGNHRPLLTGAVALHASFTVSDETVREAGALCRELGTVMHIHLAEDGADVEDAKERGYQSPLDRLVKLDALPAGSILAHGVHLTEAEIKSVREAGCWLVQNPRSNEGNAVGYAKTLHASDMVALGTDGYPANMLDEQAKLKELATAAGDDEFFRRLPAGPQLIGERFGVTFAPLLADAAADVAVFETDGSVRHLLVGGHVVVESGELLTADIEEIRAAARAEAPRLWQRMLSY